MIKSPNKKHKMMKTIMKQISKNMQLCLFRDKKTAKSSAVLEAKTLLC